VEPNDVTEIGIYAWVSTDPPIVMHSASNDRDVGRYLPDERIYRMVFNCWHRSADDITAYHELWRGLRPAHRLLHLVNEESVCRELQVRGIPALYVNQNAFLDETIYTPQPLVPKLYDVVYTARMTPFKRHHLLKEVKSALIIGGIVTLDDSKEYFEQLQAMLPQATFTYAEEPRERVPEEVAQLVDSARVGVCLSEIEGAMFAATEYLLCGLPVVSTPSLGGREAWFDPRFTRIVPPEPQTVAAAVQELIALNLSPEFIRTETVARICEHRRRFTEAGQQICTAEGSGKDFAREFYARFQNKIGPWRSYSDVLRIKGL
jgi:glycosyltransferase involved in cell wall biosynthesis